MTQRQMAAAQKRVAHQYPRHMADRSWLCLADRHIEAITTMPEVTQAWTSGLAGNVGSAYLGEAFRTTRLPQNTLHKDTRTASGFYTLME